ncbi:MAG: Ni/Fe-hydrogenase cytochrome b subunit [Gammaproteobacteria bacterium]|nr:Ni/Fe-hydrogenase cytochrome b subunit [Gammaproteobacteria bacterium]MCB1902750.1 Ni/Fe-hydrogenase cytochrome b subunit [Gammaproteobacteria bacterium]
MSQHQPLNRRVITPPFLVLGVLFLIAVYYLGVRFVNGMGFVTNLNGGYAWGLWVVYDIVIGTALACGGYALAVVVYVANKGKYHPLLRPALLASLLGYALGGIGAFIDMGRWWQFYNILLPWHMNFNAVMLEVGLCVAAYILVLFIEFSPVVLERFGARNLRQKLNKILFFFIALGVLLPTMHQSSLGSMLIAMGHKVHPLWQTLYLQPLLAVLTAFTMGFAVVVFEASLSSVGFGRPAETPLLSGLGKAIVGLIAVYLVFRLGEVVVQGKLGLLFAGDLGSLLFLLETALFIYPLVVLLSPAARCNSRLLLWSAVSMLFAGSLYRLNAFLLTYNPGPGYSYFPSVPEIMVTVGLVALEVMVFLYVVKRFPVLHREERR